MPRKKTTPTVATTEPDTTLNPDRAQVAAVADLPREPEVEQGTRELDRALPYVHSFKDPWANRTIVVDSIPEGAPMTVARITREVPRHPHPDVILRDEHIARLETTIAEQSARIAELEAKADPPGWRESRAYRDGLALDDIRCAILDTGHPLGDDSDTEVTPLRLVREVLDRLKDAEQQAAILQATHQSHGPLTEADVAAGYRAVASGKAKIAEWKGRRLVRLHGNPEPIAMYDHPEPPPGCMPSGFVAEVASGTTRIMSPPLKDEAEARAWCEARCGWTVVQ